MNLNWRLAITVTAITVFAAAISAIALGSPVSSEKVSQESGQNPNQVLEWNQIFIDTLIATNTPNSSSQRLGAIVHTAIFDAYNGIERRYTPIFVQNVDDSGRESRSSRSVTPRGYHRRGVHDLVGLFPSRANQLGDSYAASLVALSDDGGDGGQSRERGIAWGRDVAHAVIAWRTADGFNTSYPAFTGGTVVGQWRSISPATSMSAQGLAFSTPFVLESNTSSGRVRREVLQALPTRRTSTRSRRSAVERDRSVQRLRRRSRLSGGQRQRPLESGCKPDRACQSPLGVPQQPAIRRTEHRHGRHGIHDLERKAAQRPDPTAVTWRPLTAITLADTDGVADTVADPAWLPLVTTPSHPEYPAGHPA